MNNDGRNSAIAEENIDKYISENLQRAEKKYSSFTNLLCQDCNAIVDLDIKECPNCGSKRLAGLFTDGNR